ncbi:unnamed protein product [Withania somnifera]
MECIVGLDFGASSKQELDSLMTKAKTSFTLSSGYGRRSSIDELSTAIYSPRCFPLIISNANTPKL